MGSVRQMVKTILPTDNNTVNSKKGTLINTTEPHRHDKATFIDVENI